MKRTYTLIVLLAGAVLSLAAGLYAQDEGGGRIVFTDPKSPEKPISEEDVRPRDHSWGVDVMLGNDGFGFGFFYSYAFTNVLTGFSNFSFSEAKDSRQQDRYNYFGESYSPNKINRVYRLPLFFGLSYRLFSEDIADNFRPYVNAAAGPVMLFVAPAIKPIPGSDNLVEERDFFEAMGLGQAKYTFGGFAGFGAQFGFDRSTIIGLNVRYYVIPTPEKIQSVTNGLMPNANGFFITFNIGTSF